MTKDTSDNSPNISFTQENIEAMAEALVCACTALSIPEEAAYDRDVIAARIIDLASTGVLDAKALCERVVAQFKLDI